MLENAEGQLAALARWPDLVDDLLLLLISPWQLVYKRIVQPRLLTQKSLDDHPKCSGSRA